LIENVADLRKTQPGIGSSLSHQWSLPPLTGLRCERELKTLPN
jgi:hypothetical protein